MSLINDALKRASTTKPPGPEAPMQPVHENSASSSPIPLILCIVGIGALVVSGAFWLKSKGSTSPQPINRQTPLSQVDSNPGPLTIETAPRVSQPVLAPMVSSPDKTTVSPPASTPHAPESLPGSGSAIKENAPSLSAPVIRVHAIYYRMNGPTAVLNGRTLGVGDIIEGAKVVAIDRTSVEIEKAGEKTRLTVR